ncbi:MAG TPA: hypothetical protein ENF81_05890 [Thermotogaceae bacterium]|nr:hypothetical protein [Thermotogaceae bacterium]
MCRLAAWSKLKPQSEDLMWLQASNGGDGDGFIYVTGDLDVKAENAKENAIEYVDGLTIARFMPSTQKTAYKSKKSGIVEYFTWPEEIEYIQLPQSAFYHTRIRSSGAYGIMHTHPAISGNILVMQNGTERVFEIEGMADFQGVAYLINIGYIKPEALKFLTHSNWFIVNTATHKFWIISAKSFDPLWMHELSDEEWIIASEAIRDEMREFLGVIKGRITEDMTFKIENADITYVEKKNVEKYYGYYGYNSTVNNSNYTKYLYDDYQAWESF